MGGKICGLCPKIDYFVKILLTGGTGFIGNHVVKELLKKGIHVVASSRNQEKAQNMSWFQQVEYVQQTIGIPLTNEFKTAIQQVDVCIHLAWDGLPDFRSELHTTTYLSNHFEFLKELIQLGIPKLSVIGTCLEYGLQEGELSEDIETAPIIAYGIGKDQLRKQLQALLYEYTFELDWIRLFYMYGDGQHPKSILPLLNAAIENNELIFNMSNANQKRDYLSVEQIAKNIINLACLKEGNGIVNCCSGQPIQIFDLVKNYLKESKSTIELNTGFYDYPDYEPFSFWGSTKKMNKLIDGRV